VPAPVHQRTLGAGAAADQTGGPDRLTGPADRTGGPDRL